MRADGPRSFREMGYAPARPLRATYYPIITRFSMPAELDAAVLDDATLALS